jgi:hypothetical protein
MRFAFDDNNSSNNEFDLDRDFPLGDGTADTTGQVVCPYCGQTNTVSLDPGSGDAQEYVEDCEVCCRPWRVLVHYRDDGTAEVTATALDE